MSDAVGKQDSKNLRRQRWWQRTLTSLLCGSGVLVTMATLYLGFDYAAVRAAPCEALFRQTTVGLSTKISFLKTKGELKIGREPLVELTDRAQMTALNLKTCCTVLDAGKIDPEQFLRCKAKARAYEAKVGDIVATVKLGAAGKQNIGTTTSLSSPASAASASRPSLIAVPATSKARIKKKIEAARAVSKAFNKEVVAVRKAQALETLEILPPRNVNVSAKELEPNNDLLNTNVVQLGKWITASIATGNDSDHFSFTTPDTHRDWIKIEVENRSTSFEPYLELFDAEKTNLGRQYKTSPGANISYHLVAAPNSSYIFRVKNYYGKSVGAYLVRVVARKSYDKHEPNDSILVARSIGLGQPVKASIMDGHDFDFFRITAGKSDKKLHVKLRNQSTTLHPHVLVFDANKTQIVSQYNTTAGADFDHSVKITPGAVYFLRISDYYTKTAGAYSLTLTGIQ